MTLLHYDFETKIEDTKHIHHLWEHARNDPELAFWAMHILFVMSYGYLVDMAERNGTGITAEIFSLSQRIEEMNFGEFGQE